MVMITKDLLATKELGKSISSEDKARARHRERHPSLDVIQFKPRARLSEQASAPTFDKMIGRVGWTVSVEITHSPKTSKGQIERIDLFQLKTL